jgi:hypothetical protein
LRKLSDSAARGFAGASLYSTSEAICSEIFPGLVDSTSITSTEESNGSPSLEVGRLGVLSVSTARGAAAAVPTLKMGRPVVLSVSTARGAAAAVPSLETGRPVVLSVSAARGAAAADQPTRERVRAGEFSEPAEKNRQTFVILKGTVSRDFRPSVFVIKQYPLFP